jgi:hypothetical protein
VKFSLDNTRLRWPGVVFLAVFCSVLPVLAQKQKATFTVDLPAQSRDNATRGLNGMQYVKPGQLAIWYSERNGPGKLSKRDRLDVGDPWQLKLELVGSSDGVVSQQLQFPTRKNSSGLVVVADKPILLTGPEIHCFTPEFRETRNFNLKNADQPKEARALRASPGGTIVWAVEASETATATRIDANTCTAGWSLTHPRQVLSLSGNDNLLVDTNAKQVGIYSQRTGWRLLAVHECCLSQSRFVSQDLVAVVQLDINIRRHLLLLDLKGNFVLDDTIEHAGYVLGDIYTSGDGKTAAVLFAEHEIAGTETGVEVRHTQAKVYLYDLEARKRIGKVDISVPGENLFGVAIAPDSSEFAVLNGSKLTIYDLHR